MAKLVSLFLAILLSFWLTMGAPRPSKIELPSRPLALTTDIAVVNPQSSVSASYVRVDAFETVFFQVGDASRPHFGLSREDFEYLRSLGVTAIEGDFDSCANEEDVKYFLDESASVRLGVILPAQVRTTLDVTVCPGLMDRSDTTTPTSEQIVADWVRHWKSHPAVIAWDTTDSHTVYTSSQSAPVPTADQLETAYASLKTIDPIHPVFVPLQQQIDASVSSATLPLLSGVSHPIADIVLIKQHLSDTGNSSDLQDLHGQVSTLQTNDNKAVKVLVGVGGERTSDGWVFPNPTSLEQELDLLRSNSMILGVGFYRYGSKESAWYLPYHAPDLLPILQH
ncbi:hypothetical protein KBD71_02025 [Candidatus Woesebacteria bacterium]|nr:hypothetical protein [Candidatus Woesebacteria bacterium]